MIGFRRNKMLKIKKITSTHKSQEGLFHHPFVHGVMCPHVGAELVQPGERLGTGWTNLETLFSVLDKLSKDVELLVTPGAWTLQCLESQAMHEKNMALKVPSVS